MAATITELVKKGGSIMYDGTATSTSKEKFSIIGSRFSTLKCFKDAPISSFNQFTTVEGIRCFNSLTSKEIDALKELKQIINPDLSIEENFIIILTKDFIRRQILAIENITIEGLNANPLLCKAIKLSSREEFLKFYTYSALSRSIVTSMGYLVQDLLLYSNTNVFDGKNYPSTYGVKWDIVIEKIGGIKNYIEVKSGPNDMDKTQILSYDKAITKVLQNGEKAYWGITYGKKDGNYVSTSILETYVDSWKEKTLIGTELWDFISENSDYHNILMNTIESTTNAILGENSLIEKIDSKIKELDVVFQEKYGDMDAFYNSLW